MAVTRRPENYKMSARRSSHHRASSGVYAILVFPLHSFASSRLHGFDRISPGNLRRGTVAAWADRKTIDPRASGWRACC